MLVIVVEWCFVDVCRYFCYIIGDLVWCVVVVGVGWLVVDWIWYGFDLFEFVGVYVVIVVVG